MILETSLEVSPYSRDRDCIWCLVLHQCWLACGHRVHDRMVVGLQIQLPVQSVPIITKVVNSNPFHGEVCSIRHNVINFVGGFLLVLRFPPPLKLTAMIELKYC